MNDYVILARRAADPPLASPSAFQSILHRVPDPSSVVTALCGVAPGPETYLPDDDYPVYVMRAARAVAGNPGSLGIVIGGSGNGEQIASNKIPGIRAALAWTTETAQLARQHNDANVLSLGARMYSDDAALEFAKAFVATPFSREPRHARRLAMIADFEKSGELPPLPGGPGPA